MRTDGSTEDPDKAVEAGADGRIHDLSLSRRRFVLASGAAATPVASATGAANRVGRRVIVGATAPYRAAVDPLAREFERSTGSSVKLRRTSAQPSQALAGDLDVLVSGRPVSASDLRGGDAVGIAVAGWGTLTRPDGEWRECLCGGKLGARLTSESPVETWSETDWSSAKVASKRHVEGSGCSQSESDQTAGTMLVRGTRSYQYAHGRGGVGYYEVATDDIHRRGDLRGEDAEAQVPLLRVGHVYADGEARDGEHVVRFLRFYGNQAVTAVDGVKYFTGRPGAESGRLLWA